MNAPYQFKSHFPLHSVVFKTGTYHLVVQKDHLGEIVPLQIQIQIQLICSRIMSLYLITLPQPPTPSPVPPPLAPSIILIQVILIKILKAHCEKHGFNRSIIQLLIKTQNFTGLLEVVRTSNILVDFNKMNGQNY